MRQRKFTNDLHLLPHFGGQVRSLKSRLSEFQKRSLLVVNEAFEILSNEESGQKTGFSKDSTIHI
ncbi:MAG: hypothetical protein AAF620_10955 [Bacteroidota bacterium]